MMPRFSTSQTAGATPDAPRTAGRFLPALVGKLFILSLLVSCAPEPARTSSASEEAARAAAYQSDLSVGGYHAALNRRDPDTDPEPDPDRPSPRDKATVSLYTRATSSIALRIRQGTGVNEVYRSTGTSGSQSRIATLPRSTTIYTDSTVSPGTDYCYKVKSTVGGVASFSARFCTRTLYAQHVFTGLGISKIESDAMLRDFDWHKTEALYADGSEPQLWYMNILIDGPDSLPLLRAVGIHAQTMPVFAAERNALATHATLPTENGIAAGMWVYAIVPAPLYNDMRLQMIERADEGQEQIFRAAVFRSVPDAAARLWTTTSYSPLSYQYLVERGLEYNGETVDDCKVVNGTRLCTVRQELVGWLGRKIFRFAANLVDEVVYSVRTAWGRYQRIVKGEATLTIDLDVRNTDDRFGGATLGMESGWGERAIKLKNVRVKVYQELSGFRGDTNQDGRVSVKIAKGRSARVCIELKNEYVEFLDIFSEREVCVGNVPAISGDSTVSVVVNDNYVNSFAQMADSAEYVKALTGQHMSRVVVMTGSMADTFTNDARSFAPCLGRWPNLSLNVVAYVLPSIATVAFEIAEFLMSVDIVLDTSSMSSRGVATHEYSHTVMCEIMHDANLAAASIAWTDLIMHISDQSVANEQTYIVEAFADFLTAQVAGGMNYVSLPRAAWSLDVNYSVPGSDSAETNLTDCAACTGKDAFRAQVGRVATLLHDAFDGRNAGEGYANDGSHWKLSGTTLVPEHVRDHRDDDTVQLRGAQLFELFEEWSERDTTLNESSFLGALGVLMQREAYPREAVCGLFASHAQDGSCPPYISDLFQDVVTPSCAAPQYACDSGCCTPAPDPACYEECFASCTEDDSMLPRQCVQMCRAECAP